MKSLILLLALAFNTMSNAHLYPANLVTRAEASEYQKTSSYDDVMEFITEAQKQTHRIQIVKFITSTEGRMVPLVVVSQEGIKTPSQMRMFDKSAVLIMANIHAGEIEGKEAVLMFLRDIISDKKTIALTDNQVILFLPIFNADGNDKFGKNRRDNGPELAGVRYNGQYLDLNRDYLKLESPEVKGLINLLNQWDPILAADLHTTNGSYHRIPITFATLGHPNSEPTLQDYMWKNLFPAVSKTLKDVYGYDSIPYGNFVDSTQPGNGWINDSFEVRFGTNYIGLRNRFTILDENYSYTDYKTRVLSCFGFVKSILLYTNQHIKEMEALVKKADIKTADSFSKESLVLEFRTEKLFDFTLKSYEFKLEKVSPEDRQKYPWLKEYAAKKTDTFKDYTLPYLAKTIPTRSVSLPEAYVLLPYHTEVLENLTNHGIIVERITKPVQLPVEVFKMKEIKPDQRLYQGHVIVHIKGDYAADTLTIPQDSYFISMNQPLARLIPVLLEPESVDSLASWGFFNRELVSQWSSTPNIYPVYRIPKILTPIEKILE